MRRQDLSRRAVLALLCGVASLRHGAAAPRDQGIGGTGAAPAGEGENDRGIGGTGVIGTIRGFGSIIVNGLRISYPPDAAMRIDGEPSNVRALKVGQIVRAVAFDAGGALSTRRIDVTNEVLGRVEKAGPSNLVVVGQKVTLAGLPKAARRAYRVGDFIAVSGLRRPDGVIVASLIEPRPAGRQQIAGPIDVAGDGGLTLGGVRISGVDPALVGQRAVLRGEMRAGVFEAAQVQSEAILLGAVRRLSVEAYVVRGRDGLQLGSGLLVAGDDPALPFGQATRAVLTTSRDSAGSWRLNQLRPDQGDRGGGLSPAPSHDGGARQGGPGGAPPLQHGPASAPGPGDRAPFGGSGKSPQNGPNPDGFGGPGNLGGAGGSGPGTGPAGGPPGGGFGAGPGGGRGR